MPLTDKQIKNLKQKQRPNAILTAGHVYEVAPSRLQNGDCNIGLMALKNASFLAPTQSVLFWKPEQQPMNTARLSVTVDRAL